MSVSKYANLVLSNIENGLFDAKYIAECFTRWCSDEDIHDMLQNECLLGQPCVNCEEEDELNEHGLCEDCIEKSQQYICIECGDLEDSIDENNLCEYCAKYVM